MVVAMMTIQAKTKNQKFIKEKRNKKPPAPLIKK